MQNSSKFFNNRECAHMPCHKGIEKEDLNCLFCYCPLNQYEDCPGNPSYKEKENGRRVKICTDCTFPHIPENYDRIIAFLKEKNKGR